MEKIRQKHKTGCSVASFAIVLGISYNKAIHLVHPNHKPYESLSADVTTIANTFGRLNIPVIIHSNLSKFFMDDLNKEINIKDIKNPAILIIYLRDKLNANHAVVWDPEKKKILDPGRNRNLPVSFYQKRLTFAFELK